MATSPLPPFPSAEAASGRMAGDAPRALLRRFQERFGLPLLLLAAAVLLVFSKADLRLARNLEEWAADPLVPVLAIARRPLASARAVGDAIGELLALREENLRLRAENRRLLEWRAQAIRLASENRALRQMLAMPEPPGASRRTVARIVADAGGPFLQTRLIDAGSRRGIRKGMAVVNERGMVGRVIAVGRGSARVMLLTDFSSRIPVRVERSRDRALLIGDNTPLPKLRFLPLDPHFEIGDRVLTSGEDGLLPPGLPVGEIRSIGKEGVEVAPYVDWQRLDHVAVLEAPALPSPEEGPALASTETAAAARQPPVP